VTLTNADLRWWYREYNRKYFGNKLPKAHVKFSGIEGLGVTHVEWKEIFISKQLKRWRAIALMTLLHEMVHLSLPPRFNHGPRFNKEMLRLAKAGAFRGIW
jgi:hypothetical protein